MANIKDIVIEAEVPFHWLQQPWNGEPGVTADQAALVASLLLGPAMGLRHEYEDRGYVPNERGGHTSMHFLRIFGTEALRVETVEELVRAIEAGRGRVSLAHVTDIEAGGEQRLR